MTHLKLERIATALPGHTISADQTREYLRTVYPTATDRFLRVVESTRIRSRNLVLPVEELIAHGARGERNQTYSVEATDLAESALRAVLRARGHTATDLAAMVPVSCTGYMMPSVDAHLINRVGLDPMMRRVPITELGCSAGVAGLGLGAELARARPSSSVVVLSVELCSLCLQVGEPSPSDVLGSLMFADGAAAALVSSRPDAVGPEIIAGASCLVPDTLGHLATLLAPTGLKLNLSPALPRLLRRSLRSVVSRFLSTVNVGLDDISFFAVHPGGPKILEAVAYTLGTGDEALRPSWDVLEANGNMSSASIFFVLQRLATRYTPADRDLGIVLAFGPGVSCEMLLIRWGSGLECSEGIWTM